MELPSLIRSLTLIDDRRNNKNKRYPLPLLLLIAFCASISKHDSWYTMQDYALAHEASIRELYKQLFGEELEHVTPSHDTLNRALQVIPHKVFKEAYLNWIVDLLQWDEQTRQSVSTARQCVALKNSVRIQSRILSLPMTHIYSLFYQWMPCPSSAMSWTLFVGFWMNLTSPTP